MVSRSPQNPADVVVEVPATSPEAVRQAATRASDAYARWSAVPALERAGALEAAAGALDSHAEELTGLVVREVGKPRSEAAAEVQRGIAILRYFAQQALDPMGEVLPGSPPGALLYTHRRPRGITGLITPWNFPVAIPLWKAAPALAFGNSVLLKPSPEATGIALRLAELVGATLPPQTFTVLPGGGATGRAVVESSRVVSFTGSVAVGRDIAGLAAELGTPLQAEMGGLNASIIVPDADVERAATTIAGAAMTYAGQKCTATRRTIVVGDPGPFTDALVGAVERLPVGDPNDPATLVGPVISESARARVDQAAAEARSLGGRLLRGGAAREEPGWFVAPTLVDNLPAHAQLLHEEVFGPVCAIIPAADVDEAAAITNGVAYGLVTSVFTTDLDRALSLVAKIDTGLIRVNAPTSGVDFYAPFGGEKASSAGPREQGKAARDFYTSLHTVTIAPRV
ncbi:aldehyde dehydrogenase family protein [Georgenia sp. AZ-5]|uniref:aldehyde dehydrogenase family protein n=1 Tax=Georgenia sp. AZ-5 TaxID=3367526 RepID=UPI003754BD07